MEEYDLDKVNANLKAHPAFGQGGAGDGQENAAQERGVQEDAVQEDAAQEHGAQEHVVQAHASREHAAHKQVTGLRDTEKPETQRPAPRVIHRLEDLFPGLKRPSFCALPRFTILGDAMSWERISWPRLWLQPAGFPAHGSVFRHHKR